MIPNPPDLPAELTREQRKYLSHLRQFAAEPPSAGWFYRKYLPRVFLQVVLFGGIAFWVLVSEQYWGFFFWVGFMIGLVLHDYMTLSSLIRCWPVTAAITNWEQVDRLLGEQEPTTNGHEPPQP